MNKIKSSVTVEEALETILDSISPLGCEEVPILEAQGRVLHENVVSDIDIPQMDNSAMDGYAIIAEDTCGASKDSPERFKIIEEVRAGGEYIGKKVIKNTAIRIMTGAPIPDGADAVIQFVDTSEADGFVNIYREVKKGENCRSAGEDIQKGSVVLYRGDRLNSADIGILASLNFFAQFFTP